MRSIRVILGINTAVHAIYSIFIRDSALVYVHDGGVEVVDVERGCHVVIDVSGLIGARTEECRGFNLVDAVRQLILHVLINIERGVPCPGYGIDIGES